MAVITISRQFGSGGDEIAQKVCQILGYRYFEKRHVTQVASEMGLSEDHAIDFSEEKYQLQSFMDRLFGRSRPVAQVRTWRENTQGVRTLETSSLDEYQALRLVEAAILAAYNEDNMVIIGRGGQIVLKDKPNVLHVRIEAPLDLRAQRIKELEATDLSKARDLVVQRDAVTQDYLRRFHNVDWADPLHYHLVINTGKVSLDSAAQLIVNAVRMIQPKASNN